MTEEDLAAWRAAPVAVEVRAALRRSLSEQETACKEAAWSGNPWPEAERIALRRAQVLLDDWFTAPATDFEQMMETE